MLFNLFLFLAFYPAYIFSSENVTESPSEKEGILSKKKIPKNHPYVLDKPLSVILDQMEIDSINSADIKLDDKSRPS